MDVPPGCAAKFSPIRVLGSGGFGAVILAKQASLNRLAVIKLLRSDAMDAEARQRFDREARALAKLSHPNILTVFDYDSDGPAPWLALEYVEGESLDRHIDVQPLDEREVARLGRQMAGALAELHAQGILHRDVKPANILCAGPSSYKLGDLGIAWFADASSRLTRPGWLVGTRGFMAPEVLDGSPCDRSDLFSLGLTLLCALRGSQAARVDEHRRLQLMGEPPEVVPQLAEIIRCCLAGHPDARPASAAALEQMLRRIEPVCRPGVAARSAPDPAEPNHVLTLQTRSLPPRRPGGSPGRWIVAACLAVAALALFARGGPPLARPVDARSLTKAVAAFSRQLHDSAPELHALASQYESLVKEALRIAAPHDAQLALVRQLPDLARLASRPPGNTTPVDRVIAGLSGDGRESWLVPFLQGEWIRARRLCGSGAPMGAALELLVEARRRFRSSMSSGASAGRAWEAWCELTASLVEEEPPLAPESRIDRGVWLEDVASGILSGPRLTPRPSLFSTAVAHAVGDVHQLEAVLQVLAGSVRSVISRTGTAPSNEAATQYAVLRGGARKAIRHLRHAFVAMAVWDLPFVDEVRAAPTIQLAFDWFRRHGVDGTDFRAALETYERRRPDHWLAIFARTFHEKRWADARAGHLQVLRRVKEPLSRLEPGDPGLVAGLMMSMVEPARRNGDRALVSRILEQMEPILQRNPAYSQRMSDLKAWLARAP